MEDIRIKHKFTDLVQEIIRKINDEKLQYTFANNYDDPLFLKYKSYIFDLKQALKIEISHNSIPDYCRCCEEPFPKENMVKIHCLYKLHKIDRETDCYLCHSCRDMYMTPGFPAVDIEDYKALLVLRGGNYFATWYNTCYSDYIHNEEEYNIFIADYKFLHDWTEENEIIWEKHRRHRLPY